MAEDKLPAIQFYPGDWRKDPGVRALTLEERGAWFEILLLMWESEERGKLMLNGEPYPLDALAMAIGTNPAKLKQILNTIKARRVASVEQSTGVIYNRRMVRDNELRKKRAEAGSLGGKQKAANRIAVSTPSSSSSSSSSTSGGGDGVAPPPLPSPPDASRSADPEDAEVRETVNRYAAWTHPTQEKKADGVRELRTLGCSHDYIRSGAQVNKPADVGFWDIVKALKAAGGKRVNGKAKTPGQETKENVEAYQTSDRPKHAEREMDRAKKNAAIKQADEALASMTESEIAVWAEKAAEEAEAAKVPAGPMRELYIKTTLRRWAAEKFKIEGV
jgi:hypothetical protein